MKTFSSFLKISLIPLLFFALFSPLSQIENETLSLTIKNPRELSIAARGVASSSLLFAPYEKVDVFISNEEKASFAFTTVGGSWKEYSPNGTLVEAEVRFKVDGQWTPWLSLDEELESEDGDTKRKYALASSNPAESFQYKYIMYGEGSISPIVSNIEWTFIRSGSTVSKQSAPQPKYSSSAISGNITNLTLNSSNSNIISRKNWGADESLRYRETNNPQNPVTIALDDDFYIKYANELKFSRVVSEDTKGKKYTWPLQYPEKVRKIIIHHTATTKNLKNPKQAIADIYYYHAVTKGWGDIGYNYIIDTKGNVYEGRFGGEGVIGAHAGPGNTGSIGISVLGNYDESPVPSEVTKALSELIGEKSKIHGIDPGGSSVFRGKNSPNVMGHKDIMATSCPGKNLYGTLPIIRTKAAESLGKTKKKKYQKDYDYENQSEIYSVNLVSDQTEKVTLKLQNIGKKEWDKDTYILVMQNSEFEGVVSFPSKAGHILAKMNEKSVSSGKVGTFSFDIEALGKTATVYMEIAPMINGKTKIIDYLILPVSVSEEGFDYEFAGMKSLPATMKKGEKAEIWVKLKNTGKVSWNSSGVNAIRLGTDEPRDHESILVSPATTRIGFLEERTVKPGETGKFIINITAPSAPGYYKEYFTPVIEGRSWLLNTGMYIETTVSGGDYAAELLGVSPLNRWQANKEYILWVSLRNIGEKTWKKQEASLNFTKNENLEITNAYLKEKEVRPGEKGTFYFTVKPAQKLPNGTLTIQAQVKGNRVLSPIFFDYSLSNTKALPKTVSAPPPKSTVQPPAPLPALQATQGADSESIRVKLGFSGEPEISANGNFSVYSGSKKIFGLKAGEATQVKIVGGKYWVKYNTTVETGTAPIKFVPEGSAILEIKNYEKRPQWNPSLNDNRFRGVLEVRKDASTLIVINELPLGDYLKGVAESLESDNIEKIKAIIVAARTYALYYMTEAEKFPGKPYHLDDNPDTSQKYLGYSFESRAPNTKRAVEQTKNEVISYKGKLIKTPYFNQSDGTKTKSAFSVWGWTDTPYLAAADDSLCKGDKFLGHGVGVSGCGATEMAKLGHTYKSILTHYYTGVDIVKK